MKVRKYTFEVTITTTASKKEAIDNFQNYLAHFYTVDVWNNIKLIKVEKVS